MLITRCSPFTGKVRTQDLPITADQILAYESGELLQNAFPNLDANQREFYKTGVSADEWEKMFEYVHEEYDDHDEDEENENENDLKRF
jgi:hypothetical protein